MLHHLVSFKTALLIFILLVMVAITTLIVLKSYIVVEIPTPLLFKVPLRAAATLEESLDVIINNSQGLSTPDLHDFDFDGIESELQDIEEGIKKL